MDSASYHVALDWATLPWLPAAAFWAWLVAWLGVAAMWMEVWK